MTELNLKIVLLFLTFYLTILPFGISNHIKGLDDSILFRLNWPGQSDSLLGSPDYEKFEMVSTNNEKFQCLVPIIYGESNDNLDAYAGSNALELLMPLFKKNACTMRLESFWTYELCHGNYIKQYHEEREGKSAKLQEYNLGFSSLQYIENLNKELTEELIHNPHPDIPQTKVEGIDMPYFPVKYLDGTMCDLTGTARMTRVLYVCYEEGRHALYSIKETLTCEYEIVILTSLLCAHPSYRPQEVPQTDLHCIPMKEGTKRPINLLHFEAESLKLRTQGAVVGDISGGSVRLEVIGGENNNNLEIATEFEDMKDTYRRHPVFPSQPSIDRKLVEDFLKGDHCLQGGSGWWKYEFCYGKFVTQYHEEEAQQIVINLGSFNLDKHTKWVEEHPNKKFKQGKLFVSHFYSGGDMCDSTGQRRQVEVRLICKESVSPSSVSLYLLEPKTCEYILGVETPLVCQLLRTADHLGLFSLDQPQLEGVIEELENKQKEIPIEKVIKIVQEFVTVEAVTVGDSEEEEEEEEGGSQSEAVIEDENVVEIRKVVRKHLDDEEDEDDQLT